MSWDAFLWDSSLSINIEGGISTGFEDMETFYHYSHIFMKCFQEYSKVLTSTTVDLSYVNVHD